MRYVLYKKLWNLHILQKVSALQASPQPMRSRIGNLQEGSAALLSHREAVSCCHCGSRFHSRAPVCMATTVVNLTLSLRRLASKSLFFGGGKEVLTAWSTTCPLCTPISSARTHRSAHGSRKHFRYPSNHYHLSHTGHSSFTFRRTRSRGFSS